MRLYTGVVENRNDPLKLGRCQVRVVGLHNHDKTLLKTEDLPWAFPMQPVTSAAMSGIGHSPLGPVEGTWVVVMFRDEDEQQPIILGSIGGIPQGDGPIDQDDGGMILKEDGYLAPVAAQTTTNADGTTTNSTGTLTPESTGTGPASSYQPSADAVNLIKQYEGLRLTAYQDSVGVWTIGYGTTKINGAPIQPGQTITQAQADQYLLDHLNTNVAPTIQSKVKAPITQSMFDAMCCFTYNEGSGNFSGSTLLKDLNIANYSMAATDFQAWNKAGGVVSKGLVNRRSSEQALFLKDGVPGITGDLAPLGQPTAAPVGTTTNPSGLANNGQAMVLGFKDPKGKYPLYLNEPDTNKLARHEDIKKTVVYKKELAREKGVLTAQDISWDQSKIPYNASYPFNHVYMTESGHIMEFDDTQNSERIHLYHKAGTFMEIDANGTKVNRIVGDNYEILERNGNVYIKGKLNVTIDGDHNVRVNNAANIDVHGKATINVFNDADMNISGNLNTSVKGDYNVRAANINMESYSGFINVKSASGMNLEAAAAMNQRAGATWNVDAVKTYLNSGTAGSANGTTLVTPKDAEAPIEPVFNELQVITRGLGAASVYETPEEGDPQNYINKQITDGTLPQDELNSGTQKDSAATAPNAVNAGPQSCDIIFGMQSFTPDLQLSEHFNLGAFTQNGTRMPVAQQGISAQQIVCNLKGLAENCLEPIIKMYPGMVITSGFRRPGDVAQSSATSQHYLGQAADIVIPGFSRQQHYEAIQAIQQMIPYDQLLLEYAGSTTVWIHVSFSYTAPRKQNFTMRDHTRVSDFGTYTLIA